jgi:Zn-finger nucleic acid-binding protein
VELERSEVLIDACPECRGVWLDRGELDRVLTKERQIAAGATDPDEAFYRDVQWQGRAAPPRAARDREDPDHEHSKRSRKRSFFEQLFDD